MRLCNSQKEVADNQEFLLFGYQKELLYKATKNVLDFSRDSGPDLKAGTYIIFVCIIMEKYLQDRIWDLQALAFIRASEL